MKILFCGSSEFSMQPLERLAERHEMVAVITVPPKPRGRGLDVIPNCVHEFARSKGILCKTPEKLKQTEIVRELGALNAEALVIASYGKILPSDWLALPKRVALNIHPSLLPKYRGAAPINWQIINWEIRSGVTIFRMDQGLDSGDIVAQEEVFLEEGEDALSLSKRLSRLSADMVLKVLESVEKGSASFVPQDPSLATYAPKLKKEDGLIDWTKPAREISNRVRGLVPWPCAHTFFYGESIQILKTRAEDLTPEGEPGEILEIDKQGFLKVRAGKGTLLIDRIKPSGKREMSGLEFANGRRIHAGMHFGSL
ncbi:MAG TPA: methionyl-tRNA formyltransferase [Candidatus Omnitrophota bacterium]|nr:methionyl-tRNA formyltransferase [Candidatus Omnitrophota bacterium]